MTEINTNDEKYDSIKLAALSRYELIKEIRSLITTIESQKEEIEKIGKWNHEVWAMTEAFKKDLDEAESEIESLKAITELAVKSLEKVRDRYAGEYGGHICETEMREIAKSTLSEIEKLQK